MTQEQTPALDEARVEIVARNIAAVEYGDGSDEPWEPWIAHARAAIQSARRTPDPAVAGLVEALKRSATFIEALADNDPDEPIADNGMTVLGKLQFDAPALAFKVRQALKTWSAQ